MRLVLRPIQDPAQEYLAVTEEPISAELATYFEVRSFAFADRPTPDRLPVSVRLAAVANELKHRLVLASDVLRRLEALGWSVQLNGAEVVVTCSLSAQEGWSTLGREGIGDHLLPWLERGSDLPPGSSSSRRRRSAPARG